MTTLRILHLTDTHLFGDDRRHYDTGDTAAHLDAALAHCAERRYDLVVCAGDVSEDGTAASYERARAAIVPWAHERGARAVFAMGNHDRRDAFRAVLGNGQAETPDAVTVSSAAPIHSSVTEDGWRVIVLDSTVPGRGYGELDGPQLAWLRDELAQPAPLGTVVVVHHPPIAAHSDLLGALALDDASAAALLSALEGSDVRVVLSGHYHLPIVETVRGIPVVVAPGVANLAAGFDDPAEEAAVRAFGGAEVTVSASGVRVAPFVERRDAGEEVFRFDRETVRRIIDFAGRPATDQPS